MGQGEKARVFISCGQRDEERGIAHAIFKRLELLGFEPYLAFKEQTLDGLKENIYEMIVKSEYFLFIDFKRELIDENVRRGSLFCNQELAVAASMETKFMAFQEVGVKECDGIMKFIQGNCFPFDNRDTLGDLIAARVNERIKSGEWDPNWRKDLLLDIPSPTFGTAHDMRQAPPRHARWYHIKVKNRHRKETARDCTVYLERFINLSTGKEEILELVEYKWKGVTTAQAAIPPKAHRCFDAFHVYDDHPRRAYLGVNPFIADYSALFHAIDGPGDYELHFVVYSLNFSPARAKFHITITAESGVVDFKKIGEESKSIEIAKAPKEHTHCDESLTVVTSTTNTSSCYVTGNMTGPLFRRPY